MQSYTERATQVACESQVVVMVLLNADNTDLELWPVKPLQNAAALTTPEEFAARKLRPVGMVGLQGTMARVVFKEPLESHVVDAIAMAFTEHVRFLLGNNIAVQVEEQKGDEVAWLERLYSLPDTRMI